MKLIHKKGFTLIELLVVMAIFVVITSVVLARQNRFSSDILLTDLAYQVAISIRQAQVYGLGVQNSAVTNFDTGYGVDFNVTTPNTYIFFPDINKNGVYDGANSGDKPVTTYQIQKGGSISSICGIDASNGSTQCQAGNYPYVDVVYTRPEPAASIKGPISATQFRTYSKVTLTVLSALKDRAKCVRVDQTGQVSVFSPDPASPTVCPSI